MTTRELSKRITAATLQHMDDSYTVIILIDGKVVHAFENIAAEQLETVYDGIQNAIDKAKILGVIE